MDIDSALKNLHLKRPLVVFDLETTGVQVGTDRIVEIAMIKISPDGSLVRKPEKAGNEYRILVNPEMPIPLESSLVHGVYDDDVKTSYDGSFEFRYLQKGDYQVFAYSDVNPADQTPDNPSSTTVVLENVNVSDNNEVYDMGTIYIEKY